MMIDRILGGLYRLCGYLSAFFLAMIAVLTMAQIVCRQLAVPFEASELSGFCLAASTFFGLAYTLVHGEHVRVGLMENLRLPRLKRALELWACVVGLLVTGFAGWNLALFARDSLAYGDLSPGLMAVPMWIPQSTLVAGFVMMAVAFLHQIVRILRGDTPDYLSHEPEGE